MITQELNRGWCIRPGTRGDWERKTNVPCSVLHAMLEAKLAPDPFYRKNEYEKTICQSACDYTFGKRLFVFLS